jgi:hypothetical protein
MALFSRRCLQRLIQENARFLSSQQQDEHVRRLNRVRDDYLATEWEIAVLNAFSKVGNIGHEPHDFAGSRFLDIVFDSPAIQFGAEIATVSDQQLHKRNPVDRIWEELQRQVRKRKITTGGFDVNIGQPSAALQGRGIRHDLLIPPVAKLKDVVFNAQFNRFMEQISSDPASTQHFQVRNSIANIKITYDPNRRTWGGSHLAYTGANILDDNPVFNALKYKARHLKQSGYLGLRGVILCDGGCQMLGEGGVSWAEYGLRQVVGDFLRQNRSVGFVGTIALRRDHSGRIGRGHYKPSLSVWGSRERAPEKQQLTSVLEQMVSHLPLFETNPQNALNRLMSTRRQLGSYFGGYQMGGNQCVKLSAITVLQLLAGTLDYADFVAAHDLDKRNPFANAVRNGRTIRNCRIESGGEEDDDWITFEFGDKDPALARFAVKRAESNHVDKDML